MKNYNFNKFTAFSVGCMIFLSFLSISNQGYSVSSDERLFERFRQHGVDPIMPPPIESEELIQLGKKLFFEERLSGNNNISCSTCHHPDFGTSDGLPLSIGEGGIGLGDSRDVAEGKVIPRNSPNLFNLGDKSIHVLFLDGRVTRDRRSNVYQTPEPALNGENPGAKYIVDVLDSALAAQALFPLTSNEEMLGQPGSNPIANLKTNLAKWVALTHKILQDNNYKRMFEEIFPDQTINIGHIAKAIAAYEREAFYIAETPLQKFMKGDFSALTDKQKDGARIFSGKANCIRCHRGSNLGIPAFISDGVPQIGPGKEANGNDLGRYYVTKKEFHRYSFRILGLMNIGLSAPYMHSGVFATLEEVVEHYNDIKTSLESFDGSTIMRSEFLGKFEEAKLFNLQRLDSVPRITKPPLGLTFEEKNALVEFLRNGLKDLSFKERI